MYERDAIGCYPDPNADMFVCKMALYAARTIQEGKHAVTGF